MSTIAIVMMILFMIILWGGLVYAVVRLLRAGETEAAIYLRAHPEHDH